MNLPTNHQRTLPPFPPSETALKRRRRTIWIVGGVVLLLVALLSVFLFLRRSKYADPSVFTGNAHEIQLALQAFHKEYGSYPSPSTIPLVNEKTETKLSLGTQSSNDYFRQLIAAGADERIFHSGSRRFRRPDGRIHDGKALEKGECGFAYVLGIDASVDKPDPLLIGPVIPGKKAFDRKEFYNKVFVCWTDGSVVLTTMGRDGAIFLGGGARIHPDHPERNGTPITIAWPE